MNDAKWHLPMILVLLTFELLNEIVTVWFKR